MSQPEQSTALPLRGADDNLLRFHGDAAASAVEDAANAYQSPSLIAAGAGAQQVSILVTLLNLAMAALCLKAPGLVMRAGLTRRGSLVLSFINLIAWVPLALAFLLARFGITPAWFAVLWFINLAPGLLLSVQRDSWLSVLVPRASLGRYLGQRMAIKSACYLGGFIYLGYLMDRTGGGLTSFAVVFTVAIVAALVDFIILSFMKERPTPAAPPAVPAPAPVRASFSFPQYLAELRARKLGPFVSFTSLFYLTVGLTGPLYAVYMLKDLKITYVTFTMIVAAEFVARIVSVPVWGRLADRVGSIQVLGFVSRLIPLIPVLWLASPHPVYLMSVQVVSGLCWGAFDLTTQSYILKTAPGERRLWYIVYNRLLVLLPSALGGVAGAYFLGHIFAVFGNPIYSLFLVSGLSRAAIVLFMVPRLIDHAHVFGRAPRTCDASESVLHAAVASRRGLFYRCQPEDAPEPGTVRLSPVIAPLEPARLKLRARPGAAPVPSPVILPLKPARLTPRRPAAAMPLPSPMISDIVPSLRGLYYQPRPAPRAVRLPSPAPSPAIARQGSRDGLYYDAAGWKDYLRRSLASFIDEARAARPAPAAVAVHY